jgi:AcrR family transcriptional regulator
MRYPKDQKEISRRRVIGAAVEAFNERGIAEAGIEEIMQRAGLTKGAFSRLFSSKDELLLEALDEGFSKVPFIPEELKDLTLEELCKCYLSVGHRDNLPNSCLASTLSAEIARHPIETRENFIEHLKKNFASIDSKLDSEATGAARARQVMAIFALLTGALVIARLTKGTKLSDAMLLGGVEAVGKIMSPPNEGQS